MRIHDDDSMNSQPNSTPSLTPQALQLLHILRDVAGWVNRTELAKLVGKTALNKWDVVLLNKLADAGLIETKQVPRHGPIGYEWQYRAIRFEIGTEQP